MDLAEERVPRDIKNFNRYILRVDVRDHPIEVRIRKKKIAQMTREDLVKEPSNAVLSGLHFLYKAIELCKSKGTRSSARLKRKSLKTWTTEDDKVLLKMLEEGRKLKSIEIHFRLSWTTIKKRLKMIQNGEV